MKKFILMMALTVLGTGAISVSAQTTTTQQGQGQQGQRQGGGQQGTPEERAERQLKAMNDLLTLTADQSAKIKPLILQRIADQTALREKANGDRDAMMASYRTLTEKYNAQFKTILTAEQYTKYEANMAQMRGGRGGQGGGNGGNGGQGGNQ